MPAPTVSEQGLRRSAHEAPAREACRPPPLQRPREASTNASNQACGKATSRDVDSARFSTVPCSWSPNFRATPGSENLMVRESGAAGVQVQERSRRGRSVGRRPERVRTIRARRPLARLGGQPRTRAGSHRRSRPSSRRRVRPRRSLCRSSRHLPGRTTDRLEVENWDDVLEAHVDAAQAHVGEALPPGGMDGRRARRRDRTGTPTAHLAGAAATQLEPEPREQAGMKH